MLLDSHVHTICDTTSIPELKANMAKAGVDGMVLISDSPGVFPPGARHYPVEKRIREVLALAEGESCFYPFFFIDPTEPDAVDQVDLAVEMGIQGFKIICNRYYPYDERCLPVYRRIARHNRPLLFHSGILYDGRNASGNFGRPCNFEILLSIDGLRFALAHVSWPWTDECIAVYGKFNNCVHVAKQSTADMFVDLTPGTPAVYRREVFQRLLFSCPNVDRHIIWGTDNFADSYSPQYATEIYSRDKGLFDELGIDGAAQERIFSQNLLRFIKGR